jgi:hypothetical protein
MKRKTLSNQALNPSNCLEMSDKEAESLQGGIAQERVAIEAYLSTKSSLNSRILFLNHCQFGCRI